MIQGLVLLVLTGASVYTLVKTFSKKSKGNCGCGNCQCGGK